MIDISGRILPQNQVAVYPSIRARVIEAMAGVGDRVVQGRVLARVIQDLPGSDYRRHDLVEPIARGHHSGDGQPGSDRDSTDSALRGDR